MKRILISLSRPALLVLLAVVSAESALLAQATLSAGLRVYRSPNHVILAVRPLAPSEQSNGIIYTENETKYAVTSWGSSCAVSKNGFLVTNEHAVPQNQVILVGGWSDTAKLVHASVEVRDKKDDLALLKLEPPNELAYINSFRSTEGLLEGQEVFIWAYLQIPWGFVQFLRRGVVSMNAQLEGSERYVYIETSASFGTSGSPVFVFPQGEAIGIVSQAVTLPGGFPLPAGVLGVIPGERVSKFLKDAGVPGY